MDGMKSKYTIITKRTTKAMPKSTSFYMTGAMGITNLGKYPLVIIPDAPNKLPLAPVNAPEK